MKEEETYLGEWPVKPYYKRDLPYRQPQNPTAYPGLPR